jgi:hypothetical protein
MDVAMDMNMDMDTDMYMDMDIVLDVDMDKDRVGINALGILLKKERHILSLTVKRASTGYIPGC